MHAKDTISVAEFKKLLAKLGCTGDCSGLGSSVRFEFGEKCPHPCDPALLQEVEDEAKAKAKQMANQMCRSQGGHDYCVCVGTYLTLVAPQCITVQSPGGNDVCVYFAFYLFKGNCRILV